MPATGLVVGLGNPILSDDAVGLRVAERLEELYQQHRNNARETREAMEWQFITFDGNPLDLVSYLDGVGMMIVIDSEYPNNGGPASVVELTRGIDTTAPRAVSATGSHGINILDMLDLAYRLDVANLSSAWLVLIPVDDPFVLGEQLTEPVARRARAVTEYIWGRWLSPSLSVTREANQNA